MATAEIKVGQATLPELLGYIARKCTEDSSYMPQARKDLYLWYQAQDMETRKDIAREARTKIDNARLCMEGMLSEFLSIAMRDL